MSLAANPKVKRKSLLTLRPMNGDATCRCPGEGAGDVTTEVVDRLLGAVRIATEPMSSKTLLPLASA